MKNVLFFLAMAFITVNANAQWFLGGNLGVYADNMEESMKRDFWQSTTKINEFGFSIAPTSGYYFNEKFALGLSLHFRFGTRHKTDEILYDPSIDMMDKKIETRAKSFSYGASPFVRFSVFTYKKLSIQLETSVGIGYQQFRSDGEYGAGIDGINQSIIGITVLNVAPMVAFNLSKHFQLEAGLRFLNLGYDINIRTDKSYTTDNQYELKNITHNFNTAFSSSNILSMSWFSIGAIYKF